MYIDPNSGGLLFQALLVFFGLFSGVVLLFSSKIKFGIAKIRRALRERFRDNDIAESNPEYE